jgi:hypothetical protein
MELLPGTQQREGYILSGKSGRENDRSQHIRDRSGIIK